MSGLGAILPAIAGGCAWAVLILVSSVGLTGLGVLEHLFLLALLVVVPLGLALAIEPGSSAMAELLLRGVLHAQPVAALLVVGSFWLEPGILAAALVTGWALLCGLLGLAGLERLLRGGFRRAEAACVCAGLMLLPVGAGGLLVSRLGVSLLGFREPIVFLTAMHFHYTGFAAPLIAGATGRAIATSYPRARNVFGAGAAGVIAGPPLIAIGFLFSPWLQVLAVGFLSISLILLCALLILWLPTCRGRVSQALLAVAAGSLTVGMFLAAAYAVGEYTGTVLVSIPQMAWFHGILNAIGFCLCGLVGWLLDRGTDLA